MSQSKHPLAEDISIHIFTVSAAMLGVCITVVSLLRVSVSLNKSDTIADDLVSLDAMIFLMTCLMSYWALRMRHARRNHKIERVADALFMLGLVVMTITVFFITYEVVIR